jgi:hypothetical protein
LKKLKIGGCAESVDRDWRDISLLPVTLLDFTGNLNNGIAKINWKVTNESNVRFYVVERSTDGQNFTPISNVKATASGSPVTPYSITDNISSLSNTTVYYRLKQVDLNGASKYSGIVAFKLVGAAKTISIYPNPAMQYAVLQLKTPKEGTAVIKLTDVTGRPHVFQQARLTAGLNSITLKDIKKLAAGTYNVQVIFDGLILTKTLVVAK